MPDRRVCKKHNVLLQVHEDAMGNVEEYCPVCEMISGIAAPPQQAAPPAQPSDPRAKLWCSTAWWDKDGIWHPVQFIPERTSVPFPMTDREDQLYRLARKWYETTMKMSWHVREMDACIDWFVDNHPDDDIKAKFQTFLKELREGMEQAAAQDEHERRYNL